MGCIMKSSRTRDPRVVRNGVLWVVFSATRGCGEALGVLPTRDMSGSVVLQHQVSVVSMAVAFVTIKDHEDCSGLGCHLGPFSHTEPINPLPRLCVRAGN